MCFLISDPLIISRRIALRFPKLDVYETVSIVHLELSQKRVICGVQFYWLTLRGSPNVQRSRLNVEH